MNKKIEDFLCPSWEGDRLICADNIFSRLSYMFQDQAKRHGRRIGALHIKFSDGIAHMLSHEDFTTCTEKRTFEWKSSEKHKGLYYDRNVFGKKPKNIPVKDILNEGTSFSKALSKENTMEDLQLYISSCCDRRSPYGYGFTPDVAAKFEVLGALNMYKMNDFLFSCKDLLKKYERAEGIVTPSGLAAPAGTITPVHLEDHKLLSINQMVMATTKDPKWWFIIDTDPPNIQRFLKYAAGDVVCSGIPGCSEEGKEPCCCFHLQKSFFFSPEWLIRHNIKFVIIMQGLGDIVVTETHAFHQVLNVAPNVTIARNLCTNMSFAAFTPDYIDCSHKKRHTRLRLPITQLEHAKWVSDMKDHVVTLRSSVFKVSNAWWIRNFKRAKHNVHKNKVDTLRKEMQALLGLSSDVPDSEFFVKSVDINMERNRSHTAYITTRNPEGYCTREIMEALRTVFKPHSKSCEIEVVPVVDSAAIYAVGDHLLDQDGYIDLPYSLFQEGSHVLGPLGVFHFAEKPMNTQKRTRPVHDADKVCVPFKQRKAQPRCLLCGTGEDEAHLQGSTHAKHLDLLMRVWLVDNSGFGQQCDSKLECRLCKGARLKDERTKFDHLNGRPHRTVEATIQRWEKDKITPETYGLDVSSSVKALSAYNKGLLLRF